MTNTFAPDLSDPGQIAFALAQKSCKPYAFRIDWGADCGEESEVTISSASPGVVTWNAHGLSNGDPIVFSTTGALPAPLVAGTLYYVVSSTTNSFSVAATAGGTAINTTAAGSGVHTALAPEQGETDLLYGFALYGTKTGGDASASHFRGKDNNTPYVNIQTRLGLDDAAAYGDVMSAFPSIWGADHRGDGLASVLMTCKTAPQEETLSVYPNQMPEHSAVGDGALLYDPRKDSTQPDGAGAHRASNPDTWEFSRNLALIRLDHLTKPYGGKLSYTDMHFPDWMHAANVADQNVTNRSGGTEKRYHGGFWFRANNDQIEVGRQIDEAGEMIVYERPDGKIGVHAGEYVAPTVRLTVDGIFAIKVDKNRRKSATVLAVRGRHVNPANHYNTEDAAIYGSPYGVVDDNSERTKTFENVCVQSHNHCQRKQKLTFIRANARRVTITADYRAAKGAAYSRFVRVHYPSRGLAEAVIEIVGSVNRDLRNMRITFSGIVVQPSIYAFDAATEEGAPGEVIEAAPDTGVPNPVNFSVSIQTEIVSGGGTAAFAVASWDFLDGSLTYEFEWQPADLSEPIRSAFSISGQSEVRSMYLADGKEYRFRLRAWGGWTSGDWTDYETLTATADPTPPGIVVGVSATGGAGQVNFGWTAPNSANYAGVRIYINTTNSMTGATLVATEYGPPNIADGRVVTGLTAGTKYGFILAINASGVAASAVATGSFPVT